VVTPNLGKDIVIGEFWQVVPNEKIKPYGFFLQGKLVHFDQTLLLSPEFHVLLSDGVETPPGHTGGPANTDCTQPTGFTAALLDGQLEDVAGDRKVQLFNHDQIAAGADINGNVYFCGGDGQVHAITIKFIPLTPDAIASAWEAAFYSDGPFTPDLTRGGGFYQHLPKDEVGTQYALIPRVIGEPGPTPDSDVLAEGEAFEFTLCPTFDLSLDPPCK
jgi:hypothetical protein